MVRGFLRMNPMGDISSDIAVFIFCFWFSLERASFRIPLPCRDLLTDEWFERYLFLYIRILYFSRSNVMAEYMKPRYYMNIFATHQKGFALEPPISWCRLLWNSLDRNASKPENGTASVSEPGKRIWSFRLVTLRCCMHCFFLSVVCKKKKYVQ
jgi:hypothetical protein